MIMPWNRKEVFAGFDIGQLACVREILSASGIRYIIRSADHGASHRSVISSGGGNPMLSSMYYVYVHKKDLDRAQYELHKPRRY